MIKGWIGYDKNPRNTKNIYIGINNKARKCVTAYVGVNGVAKKIYPIIPIPTVSGDFTYDGTTKSAVIENLDTDYVSVSGESATNAGTHIVTFSLTDSNAVWEDGTRENKTAEWVIDKKKINPPTLSYPTYQGLPDDEYTGFDITIQISTYDSSIISVSGTRKATNVGTYYVTFTIINDNYEWQDGTTQTSSSWIIRKATISKCEIYNGTTYLYSDGYCHNIYINFYNSRNHQISTTCYANVTGYRTYSGYCDGSIQFRGCEDKSVTFNVSVTLSNDSNHSAYSKTETVHCWYY